MTIKQDHKIMELLGVTELRHLIAHTNKGELTLMLRKGETKYHLVLDAVPVSNELNNELMDILFPSKIVEIPQVNKETPGAISSKVSITYVPSLSNEPVLTFPKKKGGNSKSK